MTPALANCSIHLGSLHICSFSFLPSLLPLLLFLLSHFNVFWELSKFVFFHPQIHTQIYFIYLFMFAISSLLNSGEHHLIYYLLTFICYGNFLFIIPYTSYTFILIWHNHIESGEEQMSLAHVEERK